MCSYKIIGKYVHSVIRQLRRPFCLKLMSDGPCLSYEELVSEKLVQVPCIQVAYTTILVSCTKNMADDGDDDLAVAATNNNNNNNNNNTKNLQRAHSHTLSMNRRCRQVTRWPDRVC